MKLPFMLKFPWGEETHFIEKLWAMKIKETSSDHYAAFFSLAHRYGIEVEFYDQQTPKLHTIRNASDRFKVGQFVQPFVWTYKPYKKNLNPLIPAQFDFMPPVKIVSKQRFDLKFKQTEFGTKALIYIDGRVLEYEEEYETLAVNDGFKNADHFFQYFNKPVENMEIRHFTNLKY
jgi:hypothetical protein